MRSIFVFLVAKIVSDVGFDYKKGHRGYFSVNALWKNKIAVLVGDFMLFKGLLISIENNDYNFYCLSN